MVRIILSLMIVGLAAPPLLAADEPRKLNILWLVCEDSNVDWIGCYGNPHAKTPNIDALAKQGFRYTHVYSCAPVCAPSRSTWITGINAVSTGTQPMRSRYPIPHDQIKYYADYLRKAGYYTANHTKTDYNIGGRPDGACWDSNKANAWDLRKPGQPFFQVINFNQSHESSAQGDVTHTRHSPQDVTLAKYHPDELGIRQNYAKYHDAVENMDTEVGKVLKEIEKAGLADDTIVIFNSDHGGVLPRSKRFLYDSGVHAPLVIRIPEKYKELWPAAASGAIVDRLVSFIDMPKTWLSLARAEVPAVMQGRIFLGKNTEQEPPYVFSFRDRMDERYDNQRAVRDKRFVYIKNYMPYVPLGQHVEYLWLMKATQVWEDAYKNKRTDAITGRFFETKPVDELYDMQADPDNVVNLADKPEHKQTLEIMRTRLREWQLAVHDSGLLPEAERERRSTDNKTTIYQMVRDPKLYDLPAYIDAADLALAKDPANAKRLIELLQSKDSALRYWAAVGLFMLGKADASTQAALEEVLGDPCGEVVVMAAWALIQASHAAKGQVALNDLLKKHSPATLFALNMLDWSKADIAPYATAINALTGGNVHLASYEQRMIAYFREFRGLPGDAKQKDGKQKKKNANGDEPKKPAEPKQPNPLQALQDAFNKGVTLTAVEPKDLPKEITDASAKQAPGATIKKAEKQEIKHTMKYVAFDKPQVQRYQVIVGKDDKLTRIEAGPDGKKLDVRALKKEAPKEAPVDDRKEIDIPEKAAKSVKAIKELYPDAVVIEITTEVYQDPSGVVDVLTYEIEFMSKGTKHEMVASPDGVIPHLWKPIGEKELPKAVAELVAKEAPDAKFQSAAQFELRAGLNFAPLDTSRIVYRLEMEKDGKTSKLSLRPDGSVIPAPVRPGGNRAYLGLSFEKDTTIVSTVVKDGPADKAGVQAGDKILALGDAKVGSIPDLIKVLQSLNPGADAKLIVQRGDKSVEVTVKLGSP